MATIDMTRKHSLNRDKARENAEAVAKNYETKLGIRWSWEGDCIRFAAPSGVAKGAKGNISVLDNEVRVEIDLPLLLRPMKGVVESKVQRQLDRMCGNS